MNAVAQISFAGGGLFLSVASPYQRELLVEYLEAATKRHGAVSLNLKGRYWRITMSTDLRAVCAACSQWPDNLTYPGGCSGELSVVSGRARPCDDMDCQLAPQLAAPMQPEMM